MIFKLQIDCDNAAFDDDARSGEVSGILNNVAQVLIVDPERTSGVMYDSNGNRVGSWRFTR